MAFVIYLGTYLRIFAANLLHLKIFELCIQKNL